MRSITSLITKLRADFPQFAFAPGEQFHWSPSEQTVYYAEPSGDAPSLLHELAHAVLGHRQYARDIELIAIERDAWSYAVETLGPRYNVVIDEDAVEDSLDSYRDWLHARSLCPGCQATGVQTARHQYKCLACSEQWRVNDARMCALRRYKLSPTKNTP